MERRCLVTVGATASFQQLLNDILDPQCLETLHSRGFTHLTVQCGEDLEWFRSKVEKLHASTLQNIHLTTFDYVDDLTDEIRKCRSEPGGQTKAGLVISHAGTGTILDAFRIDVPLIVVPNSTLKDNHQAELASEIQEQGYAIWGRPGQIDYAIEQSELLCDKQAQRFRAHPIDAQTAESRPMNIWAVSSAMVGRFNVDANSDASRPVAREQLNASFDQEDTSEQGREEKTQMMID